MKRPQLEWIATLAAFTVVTALFGRFLVFVETRPGVVLDDLLLANLPAVDLAWPIFTLIYGVLFTGAFSLRKDSDRVRATLQAYTLLTLFRFVAMSLVALDPPRNMVLLRDPLVEAFTGGDVFTKDLFFSGHTSFLFLVSLSMPSSKLRKYFFGATGMVAMMLLIQHTHYTVDIVAAPFFSLFALKTVRKIKK